MKSFKIFGLLLAALLNSYCLLAQKDSSYTCSDCPKANTYFQTYETYMLNGNFMLSLYCKVREAGTLYLPIFKELPNGWQIQSAQSYSENQSLEVGDSIKFQYIITYNPSQLPYYSVPIEIYMKFVTPENTKWIEHSVYAYFTPYNSLEIFDQADYFKQKRTWLIGNESAAPSRVFIPKDSIPLSDIPNGFEPNPNDDIVYESERLEGLAYAIPKIYKNFGGYNPTNGMAEDGRANTFKALIKDLRIFSIDNNNDNASAPNFVPINLKGARVEIWRDRPWILGGDQHIGTFFTNDSGFVADINGSQSIFFTFTANAPNIKVYLRIRMKNADGSIKVKKKWNWNDANIVETDNHILSPSNNVITVLNFNSPNTNGLKLKQEDLATVFTWLQWAKQVTNQELLGSSASIHSNLLVTVNFDKDSVSDCQYDNIALRLDNDCMVLEGTVIHEFGHFVDDEIHGCLSWTGAYLLPGEYHRGYINDKNLETAMSEGFATGYAYIIDEMTYHVDKEASDKAHELALYLYQTLSSTINPHLHHPFVSEIIFARIMLDMWDGPNNYNIFLNRYSSLMNHDTLSLDTTRYNDVSNDHFEMSFKDIMLPFIAHGCDGTINDMNAYFNALKNGDCEHDRQLKDVWQYNFSSTSQPLNNIMLLNTDEIQKDRTFNFARFPDPDQKPMVDSVFYWRMIREMDIPVLSDTMDNYNLCRYEAVVWDTVGGTNTFIKNINHNFSPVVLSDNISIEDNANFAIQGDKKPRFSNQIEPSVFPFSLTPNKWDYTFFSNHLEVQLCGNRTFMVQNGGSLEVGNDNPIKTAALVIKSGSTLNLKNNGILRIHNGSKVVIEEGANFHYEQGAQIELLGNNSILEIRGNLAIDTNAIFTFLGSGFVRLGLPSDSTGNNFVVGTNSELKFIGQSPTDKVLEIMDWTYLSQYDLAKTTVQNGKCELGQGVFWDTGIGAVLFENATFTAINATQPYRSIYVNGQNPNIQNCHFSHALTGLTARNFAGNGANLLLQNVEIDHCDVGLQSYDKACLLFGCHFHENETGWKQEYASLNSAWDNSEASNNTSIGVDYEGNTDLYMESPNIYHNQYGVIFKGGGTLYGNCGNVKSNTSWGIGLMENTVLDLAGNSSFIPKLDISDNFVGVVVWKADNLYLKEGYNNLSPNGQSGSLAVGGILNSPMSPLKFYHNHWNEINPFGISPNTGSVPIQGVDYNVVTPTGSNINLIDATPISYESCFYDPNPSGKIPYISDCPTCQNIQTSSFVEVRLDDALRQIASGFYSENRNITETCNKLHEVITYNYASISEEEQEVLDAAWRLMKTAFAEGISKKTIIVTQNGEMGLIAAKVLASLEARMAQKPSAGFSLNMEKVRFYHQIGRYQTALNVISSFETINEREIELKNHWSCYLEVLRDKTNGNLNSQALQNRLEDCPALSLPTWTNNNQNKEAQPKFAETHFELYPNPAKDEVYLQMDFAIETKVSVKIYDINGKKVVDLPETAFAKGRNSFGIPISHFSTGLYSVVIRSENQTFMRKLVVE